MRLETVSGDVGMTRPAQMDIDKQWHLKKEIPISLIVMLAIQTGTFIWLMATQAVRLDNVEKRTSDFSTSQERIIKLEAKVENVQDGIAEIKGILRNTVPTNKRTESITR